MFYLFIGQEQITAWNHNFLQIQKLSALQRHFNSLDTADLWDNVYTIHYLLANNDETKYSWNSEADASEYLIKYWKNKIFQHTPVVTHHPLESEKPI